MRIGWIRVDLLEGERSKYVVFGFDDMLHTNDLPTAMSFATEQMLAMEQANKVNNKFGHVTLEHPLAKHMHIYCRGKEVKYAVEADDIAGWVRVRIRGGAGDILREETIYGDIKIVLDDNAPTERRRISVT